MSLLQDELAAAGNTNQDEARRGGDKVRTTSTRRSAPPGHPPNHRHPHPQCLLPRLGMRFNFYMCAERSVAGRGALISMRTGQGSRADQRGSMTA